MFRRGQLNLPARLFPCTTEPWSQCEDSTKKHLPLSPAFPNGPFSRDGDAEGSGTWPMVRGRAGCLEEGGCVCVCVCVCVKCVKGVCVCVNVTSVLVCVGLCALADLSALPLMCEGRHWDWLDQSRLLLVTRRAPTPHWTPACTTLSNRHTAHTHTRPTEKERAKAPPSDEIPFLSFTRVSFIFIRLNQTEIFVRLFLGWNFGMCCFHVWGGGGGGGALYTMGSLSGARVSMELRGSPRLEERPLPSLSWLKLVSLCAVTG